MNRSGGLGSLFLGVVLGVGACALVIWNPFGSTWVDDLLGRSHQAVTDGPAKTLYTCSMHPHVLEEEPGECPICAMKLVPVGAAPPAAENGAPGGGDELPTGSGVRVSPNFLQNFAVRSVEAERGSLPITIRTVGVLAHNEEKVVSVNTKFEGWIERARVNNIGESVQAGDVLFEIYSPQLVTTQREYLAAMEYVERLTEKGAYPDAIERARSLVDAARERLRYWDVSEAQIEELNRAREERRTVQFASPGSGFIVDKMGDSLEGMKLTPGMTVLKLADHSTLWAEVEFYENDVRHLREGSRLSVEVDAFPGRRWSGKILFFRPSLNPETRTLTAFVEVANRDLRLRPQMYVNVTARVGGASNAVLVPAEAVLHSGERAVVIVAKGGGLFEPREVRLGVSGDGRQQVTGGLEAGERVVTSSQFLIDSESNLKAAITQLLGDRQFPDEEPAPMPAIHRQ